MLEGHNIICFGTADWNNPYRTNQHHIMDRLSRKNRILFIESLGLRQPVVQKKDLLRIMARLLKGIKGVKRISKNFFIFSPLVLPLHKYRLIRVFNNILLKFVLKIVIAKYKFKNNIIWSYTPIIINNRKLLNGHLIIYHCVDELSANPLIPKVIKKIEEEFIQNSVDLVFVTSKSLFDSKLKFSNKVYYFPNVTDFKHFNKATKKNKEIPNDMKNIKKPIAGFIGAISEYKLDFALIKYIAEKMDNISFVFIGPVGEGEKAVDLNDVFKLENTYFLGSKPYDNLPDYLSEFDVALLPNKINKYTQNMFPMKFFEYLAAGKPVVATELPSLKDFNEYFYEAPNKENFLLKLKMALDKETPDKINKRIRVASQYNWEKRISDMSEIIENAWQHII